MTNEQISQLRLLAAKACGTYRASAAYSALLDTIDATMILDLTALASPVPTVAGTPERMEEDQFHARLRDKAEAHNACLDACAPAFAELAALRGDLERQRLREQLLEQVKGERDRMIARTLELSKECDKLKDLLKGVRKLYAGNRPLDAGIDSVLADEAPNG